MRRAVAALLVTVVVVVLLAGYRTHPPRTFNPNSALGEGAARPAIARPSATPAPLAAPGATPASRATPAPGATPAPLATPAPRARSRGAGAVTGTGPLITTPFSVIQVRATLTRGRLTGVETVALTGDGPHTNALNARAEPILRREALRAGSADIDVVSGATYTSRSWIDSLQAAIDDARG